MTCGKTCAYITAALLLIAGIVIVIMGPLNMNLAEDALHHACTEYSEAADCAVEAIVDGAVADATSQGATLEDDSGDVAKDDIKNQMGDMYNDCMWRIRDEVGECKDCPEEDGKKGDYRKCNCDGTSFSMFMQYLKLGFIMLGVFGVVFCFIVAILAILATQHKLVCYYSTCAGLLCVIFMGLGVVLIGMAVASSASQSPITEWMNDCEDEIRDMSGMGSEPGSDCIVEAACDVFSYVLAKLTNIGFALGIPYMLSGLAMFVACYACCCCKTAFAPPADDATQHHAAPAGDAVLGHQQEQDQDHDDFPGAEFYPVGGGHPTGKSAGVPPPAQPGLYPAAY